MREQMRGYTDAVIEEAASAGRLAEVAADVAGVVGLLQSHEDLRAVLSDPGVAGADRRAVLGDLLSGRVDDRVVRLVAQAVELGRASEVSEDLAWVASRAEAARDRRRESNVATLGRHGALERCAGYVSAVLEVVDDREVLSEIEDQLFRFERVVDASPDLAEVLQSPVLAAEIRLGVVSDLLAGRALEPARRLVVYLTRVGRPRDFVELLKSLVERVGREADLRVVVVRAVVALTAEQEERLSAALSLVVGQQLEVRVTVDPSVLGGFVATVGDTMIDASVRHRLDSLRERLTLPEATTTRGAN
jgi:F-type H+-transporting ATPase subunit delta